MTAHVTNADLGVVIGVGALGMFAGVALYLRALRTRGTRSARR